MDNDSMGCADAIAAAIDALETAHCVEGLPADLAAVVATLEAILAQRGCEHFDPAVSDGRLTRLMDIVIFG